MTAATPISRPSEQPARPDRRLLYIDMAYTVEVVRQKKHGHFFNLRNSNGYFRHVWGVHPLADIAGKKSRKLEVIAWSNDQTIIEGVAESLRLPGFLLPINFLWSQSLLLAKLTRLIRKESIDVISATDPYYSGLLGLMLKKLTGRPLIVSVFGNHDELYEATGALAMPRLFRFRWIERRIARGVLGQADLVIAQNENNMAAAKANGARGRTVIIPAVKHIEPVHRATPADRPLSATLQNLGLEPGVPLMIYVGRFLPLKHPDEAVRAMAHVIGHRPEARGLLAGSGPMQAQLQEVIEHLGMSGRIHLVGHLDQEELSRLLPHCITVSPLTGLALVEAALAGSPLVVFDRDWQSEFVADGVNGFVTPFRDHRSMAERILRIMSDDKLRARMSLAARQRALDYPDHDSIFAKEQEQFEQLLAGR